MILTIKWHFDYLAKTRRDPDELNLSIRFLVQYFINF